MEGRRAAQLARRRRLARVKVGLARPAFEGREDKQEEEEEEEENASFQNPLLLALLAPGNLDNILRAPWCLFVTRSVSGLPEKNRKLAGFWETTFSIFPMSSW